MSRVIIAGTHSGVGKTTLVSAILAALRKQGVALQPFKIGPDYIDPGFHTVAAGKTSRNLDTWILPAERVKEVMSRNIPTGGLGIIEGVMGLYDGSRQEGTGSSAHVARLTQTPVILVVDGKGMGQSAAAVVLGYRDYDPEVDLKGVIFNNLGSESHYQLLKKSVEEKTGVKVLGYFPKNMEIKLGERHLGLVPAIEKDGVKDIIESLSLQAEKTIDLKAILKIARDAPLLKVEAKKIRPSFQPKIPIALAYDKAFHFYYQENLETLEELGAEIIPFSPLVDFSLPENIAGIYIGGGYPEVFAKELSGNKELLKSINRVAQKGMPIYAECGGFMYLMKSIEDRGGKAYPMAEIFPFSASMGAKLKFLGYRKVTGSNNNFLLFPGEEARGHEFHYSYLEAEGEKAEMENAVFRLLDKEPEKGGGLRTKNVIASYFHLHFYSNLNIPRRYLFQCQNYLAKREEEVNNG